MAARMDRMDAKCVVVLALLTGSTLAVWTGCRRIPPPPQAPVTTKPVKEEKTATTTSAPTSRPAPFLYTVQRGDRLDRIAERFSRNKANVQVIMDLNPGLDPRNLQPGRQIWLPGKWKAKLPPEQQLEKQ